MRQILTMALGLLMAVAMQGQTYWNGTSNKTFSGSGTQTDPYLIGTPEQLAGLAERTNVDKEDFAGQYIKLTADIYLTDFSNPDTTAWLQWEPIAHHLMRWGEAADTAFFRGHFDGDGHTIYNMYYGAGMNWGDDWDPNDWDIDISTYDFSVMYKALFVHADGATIENVRLANARMAGVTQAFLVVDARAGTVIRNCHAQGEMRGTQSGAAGLVNGNHGLIENCSVDIVTDLQGGGAFVGTNETDGVIRNCSSTGSMRCTMSDGAGFVSTNHGLIEKCTADVDIQALYGPSPGVNEYGNHPMWYRSGAGFVVTNEGGTIRECAAFGDIASEGSDVNYIWRSGIAGFCYRNWGSGRIESCYCTGALRDISDSTNVGGNPSFASFCYDNGYDAIHINDGIDRGDIINCYSTSTIRHHDASSFRNDIHAFVASYHGYGGFYSSNVEQSQHMGCYFNQDGLPVISEQSEAVWNGVGKSLAQMQSQAFVDTLNMLASFMGLSQWELRDGLPRPTGVYSTNTSILFGGGEGTKVNPYLIATKAHLSNLSWLVNQGFTFKDKYFLQTADIALNAPMEEWEEVAPTRWTPIASPRTNPWYRVTVINEFKGVYDGGFHEIQNMYINTLSDKQGLFCRIAKGAELRNLGVTDAYVRASNLGILVGEIYDKPRVIQCWTSGDAATQGQYQGDMGGLIGTMSSGAYVLNCASSAQLTGAHAANLGIWVDAICGGYPYDGDTLVNFLYTGSMNRGTNCTFRYKENFFADKEKAHTDVLGDGIESGSPISCAVSTEYMQSKELVNIYNYSVTRWNEQHAGNDTLQLNYWEWQESAYPRIAQDPSWRPALTITFNTTGGSHVTTKYIYPGSEVLPPQRPLRSGYIFAGWYKDPELTQFFDWKTEHPTSSLTLYARWHEDKRFEIDVTPFQNEFTKTYHIKTAAQLRGFAAMQNGLYSWTDSVPCYDDTHSYAADNLTQTQAPMSFKGKKVVLDNDIVLCDTTDWQYWGRGAFGLPFIPIGWYYGINGEGNHTFYGTFDGQGHTIYGMYMEKNGTPGWSNNAALFAIVGDSAIIRNVGIAASVIDGQDYNTRGQYKDATKYWSRCGYSDQGWNYVGMLIGATVQSTIEQCYAEGNIYCTDAKAFIGNIDNYWALHNDTVSNCYSRVNVYDKYGQPEGSFMSSDWSSTIINCYSAGVTKAGICGCASSGYGTITHNNTYYNKELAHSKLSCDNSKGCTTNEMHAKATYHNWDFENIWGRNEAINDGYPYLRVFHSDAPEDSQDPIIVTGVTLNVTDTTLYTGQTLQMVATVLPAEAANKKVTWTSSLWGIGSSNEFASEWFEMDENGLITTHVSPNAYYNGRSGKIRVIATTEEGEYTAECLLNIAQPQLNMVCVASRRVGETDWKVLYNQYVSTSIETVNFEYLVLAYTDPDDARVGLTWSVSNTDVLEITELSDTIYDIISAYNTYKYHCSRAIVRAKQASENWLEVRATLANGITTALSAHPQLNELTFISICQHNYSAPNTEMSVGETQQLIADYYAYVSYAPILQWSSSNPNVLTVDQNGLVTAVGIGTATITVTAVGTNVSATTATITVSAVEATGITINEGGYWDTFELYEGETKQLTATIQPENTTDKTVTWSSNNTAVATVDQNGLVTAVGVGTAQIGVTTSNGMNAYTNIRVKAVPVVVPESITINEKTDSYIQINKGETFQLTATVLPENAADKSVTWESDDTYIVWINGSTGLVIAQSVGIATITARTSNGLEDYITLEVVEQVTPPEPTYYTIRFLNWDGAELQNSQVKEGEIPSYGGATPVRPEDENYTYSFSGWSPAVVAATADADYIAQYTATAKLQPVYYTIQFLNYDGTILQSSQVLEGEMPTYTGATPTHPEDAQFTYEFSGWLPTIVAATANATYIAQFNAIKKTVYYTVTFLDWDGTELLVETVEEGHDANGPETNPTRDGWIFTGWSKPITNITSNLIIIAQYELIPQPVYYTIRFLNYDGTELQSSQVLEGEMPTYNGATPTKPEDDNYTYSFSGWSPAIALATADADYTAQYTATPKTVVQPSYLPYNLNAAVDGNTVTFSWEVQDLPTYFGIGIYYGSQEVFLGTTMNNNTSLTLSSFFEQFGTYTWKLCGANENRQQITEWVDGPAFEIHDPHEGIENTPFPSGEGWVEARKVLINGTIFILRGEKVYNAQGALVK